MASSIPKNKMNISGYRGIWPETLNENIVRDFAVGFARFIHEKGGTRVLIARDSRETGQIIEKVMAKTLASFGLNVSLGGIIPTPTAFLAVREKRFDGAVMITASHNPIEYNGLKFADPNGFFTSMEDNEKIQRYAELDGGQNEKSGEIAQDDTLIDLHIQKIFEHIDSEKIISKKFKVLLDPVNGAGSRAGRMLLEALGCEVKVINEEMNGKFGRPPEPNQKNLKEFGPAVLAFKADIGFAQDPDADRLVLCDETGYVLNEELTLALEIASVLPKEPGNVAVNISTSNIISDIATANNSKVWRSKVGEANVMAEIKKRNAVIGGEGSGAAIYPKINNVRDSLIGIALALEKMAVSEQALSQIVADWPKYESYKGKADLGKDLGELYAKLKADFPEATVDELDGLRLDFKNGSWIHVRPSNTEPIVRIIGEAKDAQTLDALVQKTNAVFA